MHYRFSISDSFVGYQEDTPSSIVLHVCQQLNDERQELCESKVYAKMKIARYCYSLIRF